VSFSFGTSDEQEAGSKEMLVQHADAAMYRLKLRRQRREGADVMSLQQGTADSRRQEQEWISKDLLPYPARVLLAEDDRELRRLLAARLRKVGYLVVEAGTGFELLEHLGKWMAYERGFDLVITDIRMPGVTGLAVVNALRQGFTRGDSGTPVIVLTAFGDEETYAEAKRLGAVIFDKPFDIDEFRARAMNMVSPSGL
jgi:CheY-like chemotaxis protein